MSRFDWPLDRTLARIGDHGLIYKADGVDHRVWWAVCPCCLAGDWTLRIREAGRGGPVSFYCSSGCHDGQVRDTVERDPVEARIAELERREARAVRLASDARDLAARAIQQLADATTPAHLQAVA